MDISSLLLNRPSLIDYLDQGSKGQTSYFSDRSSQISNLLSEANPSETQSSNASYVLDLSPEAQQALNNQNSSSGETNSYIQKAQKHFLSFFQDQGIDLDNLSSEATELLAGIIEVLEESGATARDTKTNQLELEASDGKRRVYTLTGNNRRLRIAIEEAEDGSKTLTITDVHDNTADIAEIKIQKDGENAQILIERSEETFAHGRRIDRQEQDPLNINVY